MGANTKCAFVQPLGENLEKVNVQPSFCRTPLVPFHNISYLGSSFFLLPLIKHSGEGTTAEYFVVHFAMDNSVPSIRYDVHLSDLRTVWVLNHERNMGCLSSLAKESCFCEELVDDWAKQDFSALGSQSDSKRISAISNLACWGSTLRRRAPAACPEFIVWASPSTGHAGARNGQRRVENNDFSYFIQEPTHHEVHLNCFGVMLRIDSRNAPPSGQRGRLPGTGMAEMRRNLYVGPSWGYVGPSGVMLGAMFANLGVIWGYVATSWPPAGLCCGRCWTVGHPPRWFWAMLFSWLHLHTQNFAWKSSPQWPARHPLHFCNTISLKKLNPAGDGHTPDEHLKAPTSGLRGSRRRFPKRSAAPGGFPVAEATIQATTSLPLHGMAGFKGCRPVPPTPDQG